LVNRSPKNHRFLWALAPCAAVLVLAAWLRGAEYDEQYTLFLTSGVPRPDWPETAFPAGLARTLQSGDSTLGAIAPDLRSSDVHPPLYFWLVSLWRAIVGHGLFHARLLSVALGLGALGLIGVIARQALLPPVWAMLLTLGCYGFTYTSVVARGFALAQVLLLGGVVCVLSGRSVRRYVLAGTLFGAATFSNYLAVFTAGAFVLAVGWEGGVRSSLACVTARASRTQAVGLLLGFLAIIPLDLWWFLAQRGSRPGQFSPFSLGASLARLAARFAGAILGGLPLYFDGAASVAMATVLGLLLIWLVTRIVRRWRDMATKRTRAMFACAALAPPVGLLLLGALFNNTPIEVRYLTFSTPFVGLLLAGALRPGSAAVLLALQAATIAGLMFAPQTMQPARAVARAAAALAADGVVLLPRGNDGVGVVGAFAIEAPPTLPLLLIGVHDTPEHIASRLGAWHRVVLALLEQDDASRTASAAMRQALSRPGWKEVARGPNVEVYERGD
jgi:Dolichyl-phosphate-mannose-protein mannosyltransferase